ncbi:sigma-54-dependent Fis family transcriptional regulator [Pseudoxanthomonas sp. Root630]|uniref:sigma-54 interaction domain-containing protein n=1 Tax=Pseudoxanthomonas sp. Root630 TaxID=1736574 RepID=UPI000A69DBEB|nr:sigma-54-dependent Fis family transcriptional regulator [Pseudoxanthomonas sp. Root630]
MKLPPLLLSYLESLPEPHVLFDRQYQIVAANAAYAALYAGEAPVVGRTCHQVSHGSPIPCDKAGESCPLAAALASGQRERAVHLHHVPGGEEYFNVELTPLRGEGSRNAYFLEKMEPLRISGRRGAERHLVGRSAPFRAMLELITRACDAEVNVLIQGESGSGKEVVAQALHDASPRRAHPFVVLECASLSETLFESELFGHERGAFTGALSTKKGLVEIAHGGTLFLDELGDIPLAMQVKLLRLIETGCYRRVGSTELRLADVRIVSATHRDLRAMVEAGSFRQDLYYRVSTFPIRVPPLRERLDDLEGLVRNLLQTMEMGRQLTLAPSALDVLRRHDFPGNVRELRNLLERAAIFCDGTKISERHIQNALALTGDVVVPSVKPAGVEAPKKTLKAMQADLVKSAARAHTGSRKALAERLGISERTLYRRLRSSN